MNTYKKYCPCVYVAECDEKHEKGEIIQVTTRHEKENPCVVYNLVLERNGKYYYSITRADGFNSQQRAHQKAERYKALASGALASGNSSIDKAIGAVKDIPFGQPILVDHYSAKKHRRAIEVCDTAMRKGMELREKAADHEIKAEYWEKMEGKIDLSMPESIGYFAHLLEKLTKIHAGLKDGSIPREYGMQLQYAKKAVNDAKANYETAVKLWG